ncbi:tetratricopeptide repeat protein [Martelella soudanensis]|uniref:tetratricopeptide repeat protein n=1 Tax=unclassified Martelella TaxID=2629616 RepID=UPI0015DEC3E2|nr:MULTISPECIES: tetratricopeptide repeat protein [unclassified Martelella]
MTIRSVITAAMFLALAPGVCLSATMGQFAIDPELVAGDRVSLYRGGRLLPPGLEPERPTPYRLALARQPEAELPDLPPEPAYAGPVDLAYGAYQRGAYEAAYEAALQRSGRGDARAETLIGELVERRLIAESKAGPSLEWYRMAAESGEPFALNRYGMALLTSGEDADRQKGAALLQQAARAGDPLAEFNYGSLLIEQNPGTDGLKLALPWFEASADADIADAQYALSQIYPVLDDLPEEKKALSIFWLRRAADGEHDTAQLDLALALINGKGMPRDIEQGVDWLRRAALNGNPAAMSRLAYLYREGIGVRQDAETAATFYLSVRRLGLVEPEMEELLDGLGDETRAAAVRRSRALARRY